MEESHTKQFCERCFEQGDRKSQQNELELVLELDGDFFWEEDGVCGCRNKWRGATMGPRDRGARPGEWVRPPPSWPGACPPAVFSMPKILKYSIKNHTKFAGHLENFYFRGIFILHG